MELEEKEEVQRGVTEGPVDIPATEQEVKVDHLWVAMVATVVMETIKEAMEVIQHLEAVVMEVIQSFISLEDMAAMVETQQLVQVETAALPMVSEVQALLRGQTVRECSANINKEIKNVHI
jgi:hypothetical protein